MGFWVSPPADLTLYGSLISGKVEKIWTQFIDSSFFWSSCSLVVNQRVDANPHFCYTKGPLYLSSKDTRLSHDEIASRPFLRSTDFKSLFCKLFWILLKGECVKKYSYPSYSGWHSKVCKCCFMKQKCHIQRGVSQYKNASMLLSSSGIHTTH